MHKNGRWSKQENLGLAHNTQAEQFKYLRILFTSDGKLEKEMGSWTGVSSAVMRVLLR